MIVSCPHCGPDDATCCQCQRTGRLPFEKAIASVENAWDFAGCKCHACFRLRAKLAHIVGTQAPLPGHISRSGSGHAWKNTFRRSA